MCKVYWQIEKKMVVACVPVKTYKVPKKWKKYIKQEVECVVTNTRANTGECIETRTVQLYS